MLAPLSNWPPDYQKCYDARQQMRRGFRDQKRLDDAVRFYAANPVRFIEHWCDTFDPRNAGTGKLTRFPFLLFPRQRQFIGFLKACLDGEAHGLVEKSKDMGATWLCVSFSVWMFLFMKGASVGWGSRHAIQVDRIGDMSSIFEKIRYQLRGMPIELWPPGFSETDMSYMKITSSSMDTSITGECGDGIGRGGRTRITFKDEAAHYEHPELIEASLSDNTRVQIDVSSVNGLGNVFHRKREAGVEWTPGTPVVKGKTNIFVMDWSDHPDKTKAWHDQREALAIDNGLLHVFRQEVERNYAASVDGVVIPASWVVSAIDAHLKIPGMHGTGHDAGLDVADGGGDRNALAVRNGVTLTFLDEWGEIDTGKTARRAIAGVEDVMPIKVQYDSIGVGSGVKAETNRLKEDKLMPVDVEFISWDAGSGVTDPDERVEPGDEETPINKDFYANLKAQGWWQLRRRFEKTHRHVTDGIKFPVDEMISISSQLPLLRTLQKELSQPTAGKSTRLKLLINKSPSGTRSPNLADAVMMCYWPIKPESTYDGSLDWVRNNR